MISPRPIARPIYLKLFSIALLPLSRAYGLCTPYTYIPSPNRVFHILCTAVPRAEYHLLYYDLHAPSIQPEEGSYTQHANLSHETTKDKGVRTVTLTTAQLYHETLVSKQACARSRTRRRCHAHAAASTPWRLSLPQPPRSRRAWTQQRRHSDCYQVP